jgi:hypothetical protein
MPVILRPEAWSVWLGKEPAELVARSAEGMTARPVDLTRRQRQERRPVAN